MDDLSYDAGHGRAHEKYGIDGKAGAVVVVRPDQRKMSSTLLSHSNIDICLAQTCLWSLHSTSPLQ